MTSIFNYSKKYGSRYRETRQKFVVKMADSISIERAVPLKNIFFISARCAKCVCNTRLGSLEREIIEIVTICLNNFATQWYYCKILARYYKTSYFILNGKPIKDKQSFAKVCYYYFEISCSSRTSNIY